MLSFLHRGREREKQMERARERERERERGWGKRRGKICRQIPIVA